MGFKRTTEGRVFFQSFDDKPSEGKKSKNQAPANALPSQADTLRAGLQAQSQGAQMQILTLLKTLNEKLKVTQNERNQMREELDAYRNVIEGLEEKSDRSERAYLTLEQKLSKGAVSGDASDLIEELENTRKLIFDLEDKTKRADKNLAVLKQDITKTKALSSQVSKRQTNLEAAHRGQAGKITEHVTNYAMLVKRVRDGEQQQEQLIEKVEENTAQQARMSRKMDKAIEDRARFMRKIERIEETVLQTRDSLNAKAMVLLTDQGVAGHADPDSPEMIEQLAALQANQQQGRTAHRAAAPWWKKISAPQTLGVSALVALALAGGWYISDAQKPNFEIFDGPSAFERAETEVPVRREEGFANIAPTAGNADIADMEWSIQTDTSEFDAQSLATAQPASVTGMNAEQDDIGAVDLNDSEQVERLLEENPNAVAAALNDIEPSKATPEPMAAPVEQIVEAPPVAVPEAEITKPVVPVVNVTPDSELSKLMDADRSLSGVLKDIETQAFAGVPEAQHDLAAVYTAGHGGVSQNYERAAFWFAQAADRGVANAAYNLGVLNHQGLGMKPNMDGAIAWYDRAADLGHPEAQYNLGIAYIEGVGVPYDPVKASTYFKNAAENNIMEAAYNLGLIHENGLLGDAKPDEALMWYKVAADQGSPEAQQALQQLAESLDISLDDVNKLAESMKVLNKSDAAPAAAIRSNVAPAQNAAPTSLTASVSSAQALTAQIQEYLMNAGLYPGPADGITGPLTSDAIRSYQNKNGMAADGRITQSLLSHMLSNEELAQGSRAQ